MKKMFNILIFVLLLTIPNVYAADATITDLSCTKKTGGVESALNATVNGLDIVVDDVTFEDVGDYMKCTFKINNTSDDDLEVDSESIYNKSSDKIEYTLTSTGGNIVKKGESNTYNLSVEYVGTYTESQTIDNEIEISLVSEKINVPDTFVKGFGFMMVTFLIAGVSIILISKKKAKYLVLVAVLLLIPSAYALTKVSIKMSNKIIVDTTPKFDVIYNFSGFYTLLTEEEAKNSIFNEIEKDMYYDGDNPTYDVFYFNDNPTPYYFYEVTSLRKSHKVGEIVSVNDVFSSLYYYEVDDSTCNTAGLQDDGLHIINCHGERIAGSTVLNGSIWEYSSLTDEYDELNFSGSGSLEKDQVSTENGLQYLIRFNTPMTFVMPNHSMTFTEYFIEL